LTPKARRSLVVVFLAGAILTVGVLGLWAMWATTLLTAMPCGNQPSVIKHFEDTHPGDFRWKLATSSVFALSFVGGHLLGYVRLGSRPLPGPPSGHPALWLQLLLPAFLTVVAGLLLYEAWSLADPARWPITYFVRCATIVAPIPSIAVGCFICALIGHWLWTPDPPREAGSAGTPGERHG
jgi:hypothetical protein